MGNIGYQMAGKGLERLNGDDVSFKTFAITGDGTTTAFTSAASRTEGCADIDAIQIRCTVGRIAVRHNSIIIMEVDPPGGVIYLGQHGLYANGLTIDIIGESVDGNTVDGRVNFHFNPEFNYDRNNTPVTIDSNCPITVT